MSAMDELSRADAAPGAARGSMFSQPGLAGPVAGATPQDLDRLRARHAAERLGRPLVPAKAASPRLSGELFDRLLSYGTPRRSQPGDVLFRPGDEDVDLIVVDRGLGGGHPDGDRRRARGDRGQSGCGRLRGRTEPADRAERLPSVPGAGGRDGLPGLARALAAADGERRRAVRRRLPGAGRPPGAAAPRTAARGRWRSSATPVSAAALALRTYAARQRLIHLWFNAGTPEGRAMMESSGLTGDDLPAVVMPGATLKRATPGELAQKLNLSYHRSPGPASRRHDRRRRPGRARGRRLRRVRGPGHRGDRRRRHRRAGRGQLPDR